MTGSSPYPGPDGVPEIILSRFCFSLAPKSYSSGIFPFVWKEAFVRPIHKKKNKNDVSNYRPIVKLSAIAKVFELMVYDNIYLNCMPFISACQHGFFKKKSTVTNLVEATTAFSNNMENGYQTDVICTDFSKAFDNFLAWIKSYLSGRTYRVVFRLAISSLLSSNSGVP
ncbi:uncharacterized protein LOC129607394 [Condylostylus longicornis]|uniref:uncharacterized protein LOC129607394 n=1 Tax=Condylostylus longicornis TaxID=2530218 RepID=UPI00244E0279|nr:uncharacterized protein LOC129607394 [Condylostylus longicornis]